MLQSIGTCWPLSVGLNNNSNACWEGSSSPETSSCFLNFAASNTWQMDNNSREGFFLGRELLLDFAAWINLTSNVGGTFMVYQLPLKFQNIHVF